MLAVTMTKRGNTIGDNLKRWTRLHNTENDNYINFVAPKKSLHVSAGGDGTINGMQSFYEPCMAVLHIILHKNGKKKANVRHAWRECCDLIRHFHRSENINIKGYIHEHSKKEKKEISDDQKNLLCWYLENRKKYCAADSLSANRMESWPWKWKVHMKGDYN